jgi:hypothetical protein
MARARTKPGYLSQSFKRLRRRRWLFRSLIVVVVIVVLFVILGGAVTIWPDFGAKGIAALRVVIGDRAATAFEGFVLGVQDWFHHVEYSLGIGHAQNPFASGSGVSSSTLPATPTTTASTAQTGSGNVDATTTSTTEPPWQPAPVQAMGTLEGEGQWTPYIVDEGGRTLAYRTALQPDKKRPYALAAIVAIDTQHVRLHFVLGTEEPVSPDKITRSGKIPKSTLVAGLILGAFNGGFQAKHGQFGAMADGVVALPPRDGLGTLVIYKDGHLDLGAWGTDVTQTPDMESWRQNGPLVIAHGVVNPHTSVNDTQDWGTGLKGAVATWRSAVGLSQDRHTLYFVVGPSLTIGALAAAMHQAGIWDGLQLDINKSWTRFDKATFKKGKLVAVPLLPEIIQDNRLFQTYKRDFFYLTAESATGDTH